MRAIALVVLASCGDNLLADGELLSSEGFDETAAIAYEPQFPLWADHAEKRRWLMLPPGTEIDTTDMDHWQLPVGAKLFKEFWLGGRPVETRVIERVAEGSDGFRFTPYLWLADGSDAIAVPDGAADVLGTDHDIPSGAHCITCHEGEPGRILGISAVQLSHMLDRLPLSTRPTRRFDIPEPALGVLHANCGHCHGDGGVAEFQRLRFTTADAGVPIEQTGPYLSIVGQPLVAWAPPPFEYRVVPGDAGASAIYHRMASREPLDQMPPMGTEIVDAASLATVRTWIESL